MEKREGGRNVTKAPVCCHLFEGFHGTRLINGVMHNYSSVGWS